MRSAKFQYKCRRCGKIFTEGSTSEENGYQYLIKIIEGVQIKINVGVPPSLLNIHTCEGGYGIADLIGYEMVKEE